MTFTGGEIDVSAELQIDGVWTDEKDYLYTRTPIAITYGRSDEGTAVTPASCTLTLNNRDGRFSNRNPMSPLFGKIGRNTPLRITVPGPSYLATSPDATGASTPDTSALDITGDLDIRIEATADWYAPNAQMLVSKYLGDGDQRSWLLCLNAGTIHFEFSDDGTFAGLSFTARDLPALPARAALRAVLDVDNGAGWDITFFWAESIAGPWTQIEEPSGLTGATSVFASTAPVAIGQASGEILDLDGKVHALEIRDGGDGTVVANPDFTEQTAGDTSFTDAAGRVWTLTGAAISDRWIRLTTEVPQWPQAWDTSGEDRWTSVTGAGVMRRLGQGAKSLDSTLRRRIPSATGLLAYWPMEEDREASEQAFSPVPGVSPLKLTGVDWAANDALGGSSPLPTLKNPATMSAPVPSTSTAGWQVEMVYLLPTMPTTQTEILRVAVGGATMHTAIVYASTAGIKIAALDVDGAEILSFTYTDAGALAAFVGIWNRIAIFTGDAGGGRTRLQATWRDVATDTRYYASTNPITTQGHVTSVVGRWGAGTEGMSIGHLAVFDTAGDGVSGDLPTTSIFEGADDGFAGETALDRIRRVTTEESLLHRTTDGDLTVTSVQMGAQKPAKLLDILQDCADADRGILFEDREQLGIRYRDRSSLYNQAPRLILDYTASGEIGPPLAPVEDDQHLRNDVTVTRQGGSSGRYVETEGPLSVQAPPDGVGTYDESTTMNLFDDDQPIQQAAWSVHMGTWDEARYPTVRVMLHAAPHLIDDVLALEVGDTIRIINLPDWLPPGPVDLMVQGVSEQIGPYTWDVTFNCTPARPWTVGIVAPEDGTEPAPLRADTAGSELAGAVSSTDTVLPVATTDGPAWITAAPNMIPDPGFEDGTGDWAGTRGTGNAVVTHETDIVHTGTGALRITRVHPTDTGTMNISDGSYVAAAGQTWAGRAWVYAGQNTAGPQAMRVAVVWEDSAGTDTYMYGTAVTVQPGEWHLLTVSAVLPAGAASARLNVEGRSGWTVGQYWIADDVRLANTDLVDDDYQDDLPFDITVGGEVMTVQGIGARAMNANPRLATDLTGWGGEGGATVARVTTPVPPGAVASLKITPDGVTTVGGGVNTTGAEQVTPGQEYHLSMWAYAANGMADIQIACHWFTASAFLSSSAVAVGVVLPAGVWKQFTATYTAPAGAVFVRARANHRAKPGSTAVWYATDIRVDAVGEQAFTVARSVNGIAKAQTAGTDVRLATPTIAAL
ncbi:carbohydrate binding domain-containing protein [Streptomyces sp. NPDC051320]|uniref:carbohydrate binding domain-containing protein n=1 Tax=Streptomyces sp. NPDC051320 TaxID=3154644 RepID=UPI003438619D